MKMNAEISKLFLDLSKILTGIGLSFSTLSLSVRFKNSKIQHLSITWDCSCTPDKNNVDQSADIAQLAESILSIVDGYIEDINECGLVLISDHYLPNELISKYFTRASKNCMRYVFRKKGKRVIIQLLGFLGHEANVE